MNARAAEFSAFLELQRSEFRQAAPQRVAALRSLWEQALQPSAFPEALRELERKTHSLAGSFGTFGLNEPGQLAFRLESLLRPLLEQPATMDTAAADIAATLDELGRSVAAH
ncbi:MAG: Hpt domain-containing protein [Pseudomonadota bacterium]